MRDMIFRGKEENSNKWSYGSLLVRSEENYEMLQVRKYDGVEGDNWGWSQVKPDTVGEYTGLKDMNGKRIFEGDIVKLLHSYIRVVKYSGLNASFVTCDKDEFLGFLGDYNSNQIMVIGNIHDNPELLEVTNE